MTAVVAVVGPTASGKTALALGLAERLGTEIVSADSMQVYRGMEIGTAAPSPEEQARVRHHFVGFLEPGDHFSAGEFGRQAREVVERINAAGKPAVVAGGSGLYVQALIDGLFPGPGRDTAVRRRLHDEAEALGVAELYRRLGSVDPDYARIVQPGDLRRIVRGLEVHEATGRPLSRLHREHRDLVPPIPALQVALDLPRPTLYARIEARVDRMLASGFVGEVEALLEQGHEAHLRRIRSLGYREIIAFIRGEQSYDEAVELMKRNTRRFAKRQLTWFRADPRIRWFPCDDAPPDPDRILSLLAL